MSETTKVSRRAGQAFPPVGWGPAPRGRRLAAWALDSVLIVVTVGIGWLVMASRLWRVGMTPGKRVMGLVVFATDTRAPADRRRMLERAFIHRSWARIYGISSFGVGYVHVLAPLLGRQRRSLYDDWARTAVLARVPHVPAPETSAA